MTCDSSYSVFLVLLNVIGEIKILFHITLPITLILCRPILSPVRGVAVLSPVILSRAWTFFVHVWSKRSLVLTQQWPTTQPHLPTPSPSIITTSLSRLLPADQRGQLIESSQIHVIKRLLSPFLYQLLCFNIFGFNQKAVGRFVTTSILMVVVIFNFYITAIPTLWHN